MKTNNTAIKGFRAVEFMREVRDKISMDIKDMNFEEIQKYLSDRRLNSMQKNNSGGYNIAFDSDVVSEPERPISQTQKEAEQP